MFIFNSVSEKRNIKTSELGNIYKNKLNSDEACEAECKQFEPRFKFETRLKHETCIEIVFSVSRFEPSVNWSRILAVQRGFKF